MAASSTPPAHLYSVHQIFAVQPEQSPDTPWIYCPEPEADKYRHLTFKDANTVISHLAALYDRLVPKPNDPGAASRVAPKSIPVAPVVVATLVSSNIQALLSGFALQRIGCAYIHISPNCSDVVVASLIKSVDARVVMTDRVFGERTKSIAANVSEPRIIEMIEDDPWTR
jgi:acyl-coenzyme A synthetase/AMP-(fatty) acid ligase